MSSAVQLWLDAAGRHPLLTPAEEIHLSTMVQRGMNPDATPGQQRAGRRARERMINANLRLVAANCRSYLPRIAKQSALAQEDLLQEGVLGLNRAVDKFDPERGFKFSTYATWWIRQSMARVIEVHGNGAIRLPISAVVMARRWRYRPAGQSLEAFAEQWGYQPEQTAATLLLAARAHCTSLDRQTTQGDGEGMTLLELIAAEAPDPLAEYDHQLAVAALEATLPEELSLVEQMTLLGVRAIDLASVEGVSRTAINNRTRAARERLAVVGASYRELVA
jgi:RNA polymerase sigma factor (sigma-70 family)